MDTKNLLEHYVELEEQGEYDRFHTGHHRTQYHERPRLSGAEKQFLQHQDDGLRTFSTTYKAARFEQGWLLDSLGHLYEQQWITDVLWRVKAGKEATVYLCRAGEQVGVPLVAAKVYRPRMLRNLKNDQLYRQDRDVLDADGHVVLDLGMLKAQKKRSVYGEQVRHQSWIAYEFKSLTTLYDAGADVPKPYEMDENAILMEYIGDETSSAPTLNTVNLKPGEAGQLFERLLEDIRLMLSHGIVHGDLSAYNVLYWQGRGTLIDFPQVVSPANHRSAWNIFRRDISRLCGYFDRQGLRTDPERLALDLWKNHGYHLRPEVPPSLLDAEDPSDRQYWQKGRKADQ